MKLRELAHSRTGDKGDRSNISLIPYDPSHYQHLCEVVTAQRVSEHFRDIVRGSVERYELPAIHAFNFVLDEALGGGVASGSMGLRLLSRRAGTWSASVLTGPAGPSAGLFGDALAAGDVDGDGHPDALCASNTLGLRTVLVHGAGQGGTPVALPSIPSRAVVKAVALGDLDGDGHPELVFTTSRPERGAWVGQLWVVSGRDLTVRGSTSLAAEEGTALAVGDFDGDGRVDVLVGECL